MNCRRASASATTCRRCARHSSDAGGPFPPTVKRAKIAWWGPVIYEFYAAPNPRVTNRHFRDALKKPAPWADRAGAEQRFIVDDGSELPQGEIGEIYSRIAANPDFTYHNKPTSAPRSPRRF